MLMDLIDLSVVISDGDFRDDEVESDSEADNDESGIHEDSESELEDNDVEIITTQPHASDEELLDKRDRRRQHVKEPRKTTNKVCSISVLLPY